MQKRTVSLNICKRTQYKRNASKAPFTTKRAKGGGPIGCRTYRGGGGGRVMWFGMIEKEENGALR